MKKILNITVIALLGMAISAHAQDKPKQKYIIAKGTKMFTGRINAGYSSGNEYRSVNFGIGEQNGFFVANNLSIGTSVSYDFRHTRDFVFLNPDGQAKRIQMDHLPSIGINLRYYKMFTSRFGFFAEFSPTAGFMINRTIVEGVDPGGTVTNFAVNLDISVTPNLVYFVTDKFAIEAGFGRLGYNHTFGEQFHSANFGVTPRLNVGMSFYLGKGVQLKN